MTSEATPSGNDGPDPLDLRSPLSTLGAPAGGSDPPAALAMRPATVLIVEDSPIIRERLAALVAELPNMLLIGQAEDGFAAQALFRQHRPDVVVLDIQLPGINGLELLAQFKQEHPECLAMVLTTYAFKEIRRRCATLGAEYFFDKSTEFERVPEVLGAFRAQ